MRIAIILAVSDYPIEVGRLPACKADGDLMQAIFTTESRFDRVLKIEGNQPSAFVKRELTEFIANSRGQDVEEIIFYFSGHGQFINDEFYYLLQDYNPHRRRQTTFENTEIDRLLKSINPKLTVKIIDACNAGMTYIKDPDLLQTYLKGTQGNFEKCYFLFSSQQDQPSFQDSSLSFFTRSIADSIVQHQNSELRYKDLIDFVSDAFEVSGTQTPFFVTQAAFTEVFCSVSETLRDAIRKELSSVDLKTKPTASKNNEVSLVDRVKKDADRYCDEKTANATIQALKSALVTNEADINDLYKIQSTEGTDINFLPNPAAIGAWLAKNPNLYFAKPTFEQADTKQRAPEGRSYFDARSGGLNFSDVRPAGPFDLITKQSLALAETKAIAEIFHSMLTEPKSLQTRTSKSDSRIRSYRSTVDLPYLFLEMQFVPQYPNLSMHKCFFAPIVSRTEVRIFYCRVAYREVGWEKIEADTEANWLASVFPHKDDSAIKLGVGVILKAFCQEILTDIRSRFIPNSDEKNESDVGSAKLQNDTSKLPKEKPKK